MIRFPRASGEVETFDTSDPDQQRTWLERQRSPRWQKDARGAQLANDSLEVALLPPKGFRSVLYLVGGEGERGESLAIQADGVRLDLLLWTGQNRLRIGLRRTGLPRFLPELR